jgi:hypothetical protein
MVMATGGTGMEDTVTADRVIVGMGTRTMDTDMGTPTMVMDMVTDMLTIIGMATVMVGAGGTVTGTAGAEPVGRGARR